MYAKLALPRFFISKKDKIGFEKLIAEQQNSSLSGNAAHEARKHLEKCTRCRKSGPSIFFSDRYSVCGDFILFGCQLKTKIEVYLIESDGCSQRHWFARFRRKKCCVSRTIEMIDLTMFFIRPFMSIDLSMGLFEQHAL